MEIVHIVSSFSGGGAENMVLKLAKMSYKEFKTIVVSISEVNTKTNASIEDQFVESGIEVHCLKISSFKNKSLKVGLRSLNTIVSKLQNPVFHCHLYHSVILASVYNFKYPRIPTVFTLHTNKLDAISRRWMLSLTKPLRSKDIIFSKNSRKWYLKNSAIIPNGVDFKLFSSCITKRNSEKETFKFLFLGRLHAPKNPLFLIDLATKLLDHGINRYEINVVGDGVMRLQLESEIERNHLSKHINLLGFHKNVQPYLKDSDGLILPSIREGMPVAILEAAASKLPIIATPVGSIPDFLNNSNAYLSDLDKFHEKMIHLIEHYEDSIQKVETLFREVKEVFDIENVYMKHLELYKSLSI